MNETPAQVNIALRLVSMLLDHIIMTIIMILHYIPLFAKFLINAFTIDHEPFNMNFGFMPYLIIVVFLINFCKDIINGRSLAKRILNFQVIDIKTNEVASSLKCLLRNLTMIIWPIEVIVTIFNPQRRIGDKIAGIRIEYIKHPAKKQLPIKKLFEPILTAIAFSSLIALPPIIIGNSIFKK